ncbi:MAG: molecular chaperone DnaK [Proteobacteria bacterium]|nr:molecular chaperone DnaK [Pseudomonadota bacterium]
MGRIIGIDLGTTNSCVSLIEGNDPVVIANSEGDRTTPSMVAFTSKGERHVGKHAKRQAAVNPERTIYGVKRLIGHRFKDDAVTEYCKNLPFHVIENTNGDAWVDIDGQGMSPQEISAMIVGKLKESAETYCGDKVDQCVVAVPAYFNDAQRQATRDACRLAGLKVLRIMNEPTLAALAFGYKSNVEGKTSNIVVFDLGGGTFDVSVLECRCGTFRVLATAGNNHLGGNDFDDAIFEYLVKQFKEENNIDITSDKMAVQRVREAAETLKCELSTMSESSVNLPFLAIGETGPVHMMQSVERSELETLVKPLVDKLEAPCHDALEQAGLDKNSIDDVLLVGGMTRMPCVQATVERIFGKKPSHNINPDEAVALGAAVQAGVLDGEVSEVVLLDVTPLNLGIKTKGDRVSTIIERNSSIPTKASKVFATTQDDQTYVDITIVQGDSEIASQCTRLGEVKLTGIPPMPAGHARVLVEFSIDASGVVGVCVVDKQTGTRETKNIENAMGLSNDEIVAANSRLR